MRAFWVMEISASESLEPLTSFEVLACEFRQESKIAEIVAKAMLEILGRGGLGRGWFLNNLGHQQTKMVASWVAQLKKSHEFYFFT